MVMLIRRHQEFCGNTIQVNQVDRIMVIFFILLIIAIIVLHSNLTKKRQDKQNEGTKDVEIIVLLKYLSNFWGTLCV